MVAKEFPKAEHRHCARHIFANWHKSYRGEEFKLMFWSCAKAYNRADFDDALQAMREVDSKAADAFMACKPELFCRAFVKTVTKNDVIVNNMAETFNAYIINARTKHLIYMLEDIRVALMQRLVTKRNEMEKKSGVLCPRVQERLEKEKELAAMCEVLPSSDTVYQVRNSQDSVNVDLAKKTCTCRKWDLTGIPCCHGVAAIFTLRAHPEEFVDQLYTRETYLKIYSGSITPCPGERHWPKIDHPLNPPPIKVGPGRPRKNRIKDPFEDPKRSGKLTKHGVEMSCSICKSKTHNKRKCPNKDPNIEPAPKRGRGRPRKTGTNASSSTLASQSEAHHEVTAQPTRVGRGGRVIRSGRGSRGAARGGARGGRNRVSILPCIFFRFFSRFLLNCILTTPCFL